MSQDNNGFRVIRNFSDFSTDAQYGYSVAPSQEWQAPPWLSSALPRERLGDHAFQNPYSDYMYGTLSGGTSGSRKATGGGKEAARYAPPQQLRYGGMSGGRARFQQDEQQPRRANRRVVIRRDRTNHPYTPVPDSMEHKNIPVTANSATCFHGAQSIFTLQHRYDFTVDGRSYKSVDQYYQMCKVKDLTGLESAKFTDGSTGNYSSLAKDLLRQAGTKRQDVDKWRMGRGVEVIQKALLEKVRQCVDLRVALSSTGDKIIVQSFAGEDFFGSGTPAKYVKDWMSGMEKNKVSLKFPMEFPLTADAVKYVPIVGKGKNILGAIYMILREKVTKGQLDNLAVNLQNLNMMEIGADSNS